MACTPNVETVFSGKIVGKKQRREMNKKKESPKITLNEAYEELTVEINKFIEKNAYGSVNGFYFQNGKLVYFEKDLKVRKEIKKNE